MNPKMAPRIATPRPARFTLQFMYDMQLSPLANNLSRLPRIEVIRLRGCLSSGNCSPRARTQSATIVLQPGLRGNARRVTCESTASQLGSSWVGILRVGWCEGVSHVLESRADAALLARSVTSGCECNH